MNVYQLLTAGDKAIKRKWQEKKQEEERERQEIYERWLRALPLEVWQALNVDPSALQNGSTRLETEVEVDGLMLPLEFVLDTGNVKGRLQAEGPYDWKAVRKSGYARDAMPEDPQERIGWLLLYWRNVMRERQEREYENLAKRYQNKAKRQIQIDEALRLAERAQKELRSDDYRTVRQLAAQSVWKEHLRRRREAKLVAQKRADAVRCIEACQYYALERQMALDLVKKWAAREISRLWQPFTLYRVRYAPVGVAVSCGEYADSLLQTVYTTTPPALIRFDGQPVKLNVVTVYGHVEERYIAGFLDAEMVEFTDHDETDQMMFCRSTSAAFGYVVNVPWFEDRKPEPPPYQEFPAPRQWYEDQVASGTMEPLAYEMPYYPHDAEAMAKMTVDQFFDTVSRRFYGL